MIAVRISGTGVGLLLRPYFRISTVRPLAFKADYYITLAPWAIRGRLAVPSRTKRQARLSVGQHRESNPGLRALRLDLRRTSSGALTRTASALPPSTWFISDNLFRAIHHKWNDNNSSYLLSRRVGGLLLKGGHNFNYLVGLFEQSGLWPRRAQCDCDDSCGCAMCGE